MSKKKEFVFDQSLRGYVVSKRKMNIRKMEENFEKYLGRRKHK